MTFQLKKRMKEGKSQTWRVGWPLDPEQTSQHRPQLHVRLESGKDRKPSLPQWGRAEP